MVLGKMPTGKMPPGRVPTGKLPPENLLPRKNTPGKLVGQLDRKGSFVWVSTCQITWINKSMTPYCKQIGSNKRSAYRIRKDFISCIYSY